QFALDRLIGIRIRAEHDRARTVAWFAKLLLEQRGGIALVEQPRLEIEAGRQIDVRVARTRVAIDAAVLAAAVRVDRLRHRQLRRVVAAYDRARRLGLHDRLERRQRLIERAPAVVVARPGAGREAAFEIQRRAAPFARRLVRMVAHTNTVQVISIDARAASLASASLAPTGSTNAGRATAMPKRSSATRRRSFRKSTGRFTS